VTPLTGNADPDGLPHEDCMAEAWRLMSEGVFTYRAIARGVNEKTGCKHTHEWVKAALARYSKLVGETVDDGALDHRAKYLQGLHADLSAQARIANDPDAANFEKIAARKAMTEIRQKIAAASGVITERKGVALGQDETKGPVQVTVVPVHSADDPLNHVAQEQDQCAEDEEQ
jgi:hypothetical protein